MGAGLINLDKVISSMIHYPRIDSKPLYVRVDGEVESGDGLIDSNKSEKWLEASKRTYNSPDNIRKIFITYKGVYIQLYRPIMGVKNISLKREAKFPTDFATIKESLDRDRMNGNKPSYVIKQTGLGALCKPWVCSNIEEIYFDWAIFLSDDIKNMGFGDFMNIYKPGETKLINNEPIKVLFETACLKGVKGVKDRFPRLRCVAYMQHLENIYQKVPYKSGVESLSDVEKPWYANGIVSEAIKNPNSAVSIYNIPNTPKLNTEYSLKDGIYLFDRYVLKDYFANLEARIKDHIRNERDSKADNYKEQLIKKVQTAKSSIEINIDDIYLKEGAKSAALALKIAMKDLSDSDKLEIINSMSTEGQERYKKLLGIN